NNRPRPTIPGPNGFSWIAATLPFFEQGAIYDQLNFKVTLTDSTASTNLDLIQQPINALLCPSDPTLAVRSDLATSWPYPAANSVPAPMANGPAGVTCYMGFQGIGFDNEPPNGLFERVPSRPVRFRDILDGTSNVLALGERSPSYSCWVAWSAANGVWAVTDYRINQIRELCPNHTTFPTGCPAWCAGGVRYSVVSFHPGGINACYADGSVSFLSETMEQIVFQQVANHQDGLPVGGAPH
ncbi:MAG: DUF1559 domain-containing protein, partial [Rhodopirellula sp.]|nr:DUF1559 domain-containing protein [Rhodopirellula sp.]